MVDTFISIEAPFHDSTVNLSIPQDDDEILPHSFENTNFGDLYILGKLWIEILETGLLGTKWSLPPLLPVVEASAPPNPPEKPPKMKYKDLPLYKTPHHDYKDYIEEKTYRCPDRNQKLVHNKVLPYVKDYRKYIVNNYRDFTTEFSSMKKEAMYAINKQKNEFLGYMRCKKNLPLRQGVLVLGGLAGFLLSRKSRNTTPKIFYTAVGLLATGALCFPEKTDETFRTLSLTTGRLLITVYNNWCNRRYVLREKMPCSGDLPRDSPPRTENKCK